MTTNERIARWAGAVDWHEVAAVPGNLGTLPNSAFVILADGYGGVAPAIVRHPGQRWWKPDRDIRLWHGPDGILAKIEEKGLRERFISNWFAQWASAGGNGDEYSWGLINSTPAQLTAALVATIKETPDA